MKSDASISSSLSSVPVRSSTSSLSSTNTVHSSPIIHSKLQKKFGSNQDISTLADHAKDIITGVKERLITKIDPIDMTVQPTIITVPQDTLKRSAMLLDGPKFRLNCKEMTKTKSKINGDASCSTAVSNKTHLYLKLMFLCL